MSDRSVQYMMGIKLFSYLDWDESDNPGSKIFYNVNFDQPSMKMFQDVTVYLSLGGFLEVSNDHGDIIWEGFVSKVSEFLEELNQKK